MSAVAPIAWEGGRDDSRSDYVNSATTWSLTRTFSGSTTTFRSDTALLLPEAATCHWSPVSVAESCECCSTCSDGGISGCRGQRCRLTITQAAAVTSHRRMRSDGLNIMAHSNTDTGHGHYLYSQTVHFSAPRQIIRLVKSPVAVSPTFADRSVSVDRYHRQRRGRNGDHFPDREVLVESSAPPSRNAIRSLSRRAASCYFVLRVRNVEEARIQVFGTLDVL